ncbi:MAG: hypothetical protein AAGC53_04190 [Actinomycetota bacterium]
MRQFLKDLRFMIRDGFASRGSGRAAYNDTFAKTLRESTHARGQQGGGFASSERTVKHVSAGHEQYAKSFENPNDLKK